jgi:C-terminal processing protease CtpA/Prc
LRGNVGYLEIQSFQPVERAADSAANLLGALSGFDAIILDLRNNGGGNTPMVAFVASYFFDSKPVHLTDIYWRDSNQASEFWTRDSLPGPRSPRQPLYILTSASTFSGAEDFAYSMQKLKRAVIVGEQTGGGAHSGRGLQRLSPLFTAFIPVGRSINPITKTNWEGVGVEPDIKVPADRALAEAHLDALKRLVEIETEEPWKQNLRTLVTELSSGTPGY